MKTLRGAAGAPLEWLHPALMKREHELRSGSDLYGTLRWERVFGSLATAETADGIWSFKRSGFMNTEVTARLKSTEATVASLRPGWLGKGALVVGREVFDWSNTSFWSSSWGFRHPTGTLVVEFKPNATLLRRSAEVAVDTSAWAMSELPLLITLGWYMMVSMADDSASAAIV